ncbi:MAG: circularly permuted type 2 ATP-grasp protein [Gammaproteobacteria bacterium]|nr:circularly permuted type 2 ATP-grasp protein [Gammaproteobacteria bacterium]MBI5619317.1 circularly permuted type 2 ATP-grasp protein [Gammaproteobacteria bacterium]
MKLDWQTYDHARHYDELVTPAGRARPGATSLLAHLKNLGGDEVLRRKKLAEQAIKAMGITFTVYSDGSNIDREWPFDIIPRIIRAKEWERTAAGLKQRLTALNMFIDDLYNEQKVLKDGVVPRHVIMESGNFREQCVGMRPAHGVWAHICGSDLVRDADGRIYVLEDNLRVPSGVSYMLENRRITKRVFPELLEANDIVPNGDYPAQLFDTLASLSPRPKDDPEIALLTPGIYNSAYFEHAFLAQHMGAELVEGGDLVVGDDDCVYMRNIEGLSRVDVIYRRIDDMFLDPEAFRKDSMLGVKGLTRAWRKGKVALANAPGTGVADDKVVCAYVPELIKYYLGEDAIIPNVPTYLCFVDKQREYVLKNLDKLVVKPANESGGYGIMIGPVATKAMRAEFAERIKASPRDYVAQPVVAISTAPTILGREIVPCHVDLRPFSLQGAKHFVTAGGLTRVAMRRGSLVVNSSQGGGSKDTWIVN